MPISQNSLQFFPVSINEAISPAQEPLISEEKRKRLFEFLDKEEIPAEALSHIAEEYKKRKPNSSSISILIAH